SRLIEDSTSCSVTSVARKTAKPRNRNFSGGSVATSISWSSRVARTRRTASASSAGGAPTAAPSMNPEGDEGLEGGGAAGVGIGDRDDDRQLRLDVDSVDALEDQLVGGEEPCGVDHPVVEVDAALEVAFLVEQQAPGRVGGVEAPELEGHQRGRVLVLVV